jgi:drug/metabolite transporter (DMT)-like permease
MIIAAFLWSLYPLFIALAENQIGGALMVLVIHISCGVSALLFALIKIRRKKEVYQNLVNITKRLNLDHWLYLILIGLVSTLYNFCFIYAMEIGSKTGTAIIIEGWPILAIFLAPLLITKSWKKVTSTDYIAAFVAIIGISLIIIEDTENILSLFADRKYINTGNIVGAFVALIGGLCLAASIVLSSQVSNILSHDILKEKKPSLACAFLGETIRRIVALPTSLLLLFAFSEDFYTNGTGLAVSIFIGVVIFCIGSAAVTLSLLRSSSSTINMIYYISPVMAVFWLYMAGLGQITPVIIVGGILVVLSNLMVINKNKTRQVSDLTP